MHWSYTDNSGDVVISAKMYTQQLCLSLKDEITEIFRGHFDLNSDFVVTYNKRSGLMKREATIKDNRENNLDPTISDPNQKRRHTLLRKMVTNSRLQAQTAAQMAILSTMEEKDNDETQKDAEHRTVGMVLKNYLDKYRSGYDNEQQDHLEKAVLMIKDKSMADADQDFVDGMDLNEMNQVQRIMTVEVENNGEGDDEDGGIEMTNMNQ